MFNYSIHHIVLLTSIAAKLKAVECFYKVLAIPPATCRYN